MEDKKNFYDYQIDYLNKKLVDLQAQNNDLINEIAKLQKQLFYNAKKEKIEEKGEK